MEADPLHPFSNSPKFRPSPLSPVPEYTEITVPLHFPQIPSSSSSSSSSSQTLVSPLLFPQSTPSFNRKTSLHRSKTAPALATFNDVVPCPEKPQLSSQSIVRQAIVLLTMYLSLGVVIYWSQRDDFSGTETHPVVDALYFCIVTMCTIGYGDITPNSPATKLFSILFVLIGFGFVDILLTGMVSYVLDLQEGYLLRNVKEARVDIDIDGANGAARVIGSGSGRSNNHHGKERRNASLIVDIKKGRMRIRMKVALALGVVIVCIGVGTGVMHFVEELSWLDSLYLSVMSVTTVGYGDRAFRSMPGRIFASIWLLVSTLAVARAFLYLAEARVDKRQRRMAKWVLGHDMTISEFLAADIDNKGFVRSLNVEDKDLVLFYCIICGGVISQNNWIPELVHSFQDSKGIFCLELKSEYVIYKLKEMGKVSNKDVAEICRKFDRIDTGNCGKIALADLMGSQQ